MTSITHGNFLLFHTAAIIYPSPYRFAASIIHLCRATPPVHIEFQNCSVHIVTITTRHRFHPVSPGCRFSFPSRRTAHRCAIIFITLRCSSRGYDMDRDRYLPSNKRLISSFVNLHGARVFPFKFI